MEKLIGTNLLKQNEYHDSKYILGVKEFIILFYGASWDGKSLKVAEALNQLLMVYNKYEDKGNDVPKPKMEVIYASNDRCEQECVNFLAK